MEFVRYNKYGNNYGILDYETVYLLGLHSGTDLARSNSADLLRMAFISAENTFKEVKEEIDTLAQDDYDTAREYLPYLYHTQYTPISSEVSSSRIFTYVTDYSPELKNSIFDTVFIDLFPKTGKIPVKDILQIMRSSRNRRVILGISVISINSESDLFDMISESDPYCISKSSTTAIVDYTSQEYLSLLSGIISGIASDYGAYGILINDIDTYTDAGGDLSSIQGFINALCVIANRLGLRLFISTKENSIGINSVCDGVMLWSKIYRYSPVTDIPIPDADLANTLREISEIRSHGKEVFTIEYATKKRSIQKILDLNKKHHFSSYCLGTNSTATPQYYISNLAGEYINVFSGDLEIHNADKQTFYYNNTARKQRIFVAGSSYLFDDVVGITGICDSMGNELQGAGVSGISGNTTEIYLSGASGVYYVDYTRDNLYTFLDNKILYRKGYTNITANSEPPGVDASFYRILTPIDRLAFVHDITRNEGDSNDTLYSRIINTRYYQRDDTDLGIRNSVAIDHDLINITEYISGRIMLSGVSPESIRVGLLHPQDLFNRPLYAYDSEYDRYLWNDTITFPGGLESELKFQTYVDKDVLSIDVTKNLPVFWISGVTTNYNDPSIELYTSEAIPADRYSRLFSTRETFIPNTLRVYYQGMDVTENTTEIGNKAFRFDCYQNGMVSGAMISGVESVPRDIQYGGVYCSYISDTDNSHTLRTHAGEITTPGVLDAWMSVDKMIARGGETVEYTITVRNLSDEDVEAECYFMFPLFFDTPNFTPYSRAETDVAIQIDGLQFLERISKHGTRKIRYIRNSDIEVNTLTDEYTRKYLMNADGTTSPTMRNIVDKIKESLTIVYGKAIWDRSLWIPDALTKGYISSLPNTADPDTSRHTIIPRYTYTFYPTYFGEATFGTAVFGGKFKKKLLGNDYLGGILRRKDYDSGIGDNDDLKPMVDETYKKEYNPNNELKDHIPPRYLRVHNGSYSIGDSRRYLFARRRKMIIDSNNAYVPMTEISDLNDSNSTIYGGEFLLYNISGAPEMISGVSGIDQYISKHFVAVSGNYYLINQLDRTHFENEHTHTERLYGNGYNNILYASFHNIENVYIRDMYGRSIENFETFQNRIHIYDLESTTPWVYGEEGSTYPNNKTYQIGSEWVYAPAGTFTPEEISQYHYKKYTIGENFAEGPAISKYKYFDVSYSIKNSFYVDYDKENSRAYLKLTENPGKVLAVYDAPRYLAPDSTVHKKNNYFVTNVKLHPSYTSHSDGFVYVDDVPPAPAKIEMWLSENQIITKEREYPILVFVRVSSCNGVSCSGIPIKFTVSYTDIHNGKHTMEYSLVTSSNDVETLLLGIPDDISSALTVEGSCQIFDENGSLSNEITDRIIIDII